MALLEHYAPLCPGHKLAAKLCKVSKAGPNRGRRFYACAYPPEQRCDLFLWAEDNPALAALAAQTATPSHSGGSGSSQGQGAVSSTNQQQQKQQKQQTSDEAWRQHALSVYLGRLRGSTLPELRAEIRLAARRRAARLALLERLRSSGQSTPKLVLGGRRTDLVEVCCDHLVISVTFCDCCFLCVSPIISAFVNL